MRLIMKKGNDMYLVLGKFGVTYTFNETLATDISQMNIFKFIKLKKSIEEKECCNVDLSFTQ